MKKTMQKYDVKFEANIKYVINYLIDKATLPDGILAQKVDIINNKIIGTTHNAGELGDYAQYIAFAGKLLDKKEYVDYAMNQAKVISEKYQRDDGIIDLEPEKKWLTIGEMDLYIGMVQLYAMTNDETVKKTIDAFYDGLFGKILKAGSFVPEKFSKDLKFVVPIANPMDNGNHIELLGELYEITREEKYLEWMKQLANAWVNNRNFEKYNVFIRENINLLGKILSTIADFALKTNYFKSKLGKPSYCPKITKQNTHLMFGLLQYFKIKKDERIKGIFDKWINKIDELYLHSSGIHYGIYDLKYNYAYRLEVLHTINLIELMIAAFHNLNDNIYLRKAEKYAEALMNILTEKGLLLLFPFPGEDENDPKRDQMKSEYGFYSLDPQIDFSVNLLKLYLITKKDIYANTAEKILNATLENFKHGNCYTEMVHKDTGEKWDIVRTKYLGLMLKPFLLILALERGFSINDLEINLILQDR